MAEPSDGELFITVTGNIHVIRSEHRGDEDGDDLQLGPFQRRAGPTTLPSSPPRVKGVREFVDEYVMSDGRRLYVLGEGRSINLAVASTRRASWI